MTTAAITTAIICGTVLVMWLTGVALVWRAMK